MGCATSIPKPPAFVPLVATPEQAPLSPTLKSAGSFVDPPLPADNLTTVIPRSDDIGNPTLYLLLGGTGQLATTHVLNALFKLFQSELLASDALIVGVGRADLPQDDYLKLVSDNLVPGNKQPFLDFVRYVACDACDSSALAAALSKQVPKLNTQRAVVIFALPPRTIGDAAEAVSRLGFAWTRAVIHGVSGSGDMPFAEEKVVKVFGESSVYRIDKYAGLDTVNRLVAFRFANRVFEPTWNRNHIRAILVDYAGDVSAEGEFFGIIRLVLTRTDLFALR